MKVQVFEKHLERTDHEKENCRMKKYRTRAQLPSDVAQRDVLPNGNKQVIGVPEHHPHVQ